MSLKELLGLASALLGTRERIILSFVGGLLIGWFLFGYGLFPMQWENAAPVDLASGYRQVYLNTVARIYEADPSVDLGQMLGGDSWSEDRLRSDLNQAYEAADAAGKGRLDRLGQRLGIDFRAAEVEEKARGSLGALLAVFLIVLIGVSGVFYLRRMRQRGGAAPPAIGGDPEKVAAARTVWGEEETPLLQVTTSYALGDDYYDPSFSIEFASGEFLGECGVGISEAIGVDDPKKVTAFEVWLFDKSQISTITKVLMSEHCYNDDALRSKLAPKGEPVLAGEGAVIDLQTTSLRIRGKVLELEYGEGNLPPNSFISRLTIELAAWHLEGVGDVVGLAPADDLSF